jgi:hypothetical protein
LLDRRAGGRSVERRHVNGRIGGLAAGREDLDGTGEQLLAPLADLMGLELKALGKLGPRRGCCQKNGATSAVVTLVG